MKRVIKIEAPGHAKNPKLHSVPHDVTIQVPQRMVAVEVIETVTRKGK